MPDVAPLGTSGISDMSQRTPIANPSAQGFNLSPGSNVYRTDYGYLIVSATGERIALSESRNVIREPTTFSNIIGTPVSEAEHKYGPGYSGYGGYYSPEAQRAGNLPPSAAQPTVITDYQKAVQAGIIQLPIVEQRKDEIGKVHPGEIIQTPDKRIYGKSDYGVETTKYTKSAESDLSAIGYKPVDLNYLLGTPEAQKMTKEYREQIIASNLPKPYTPSSIEKMFGFTQPPVSSMQTDMFGTPRTRPGRAEITEPFYQTSKTISTLGLGFGFGGAFTTTSSLKGATLIQPGDFAAISRDLKLASSKAKSQFGEFLFSESAAVPRRKVTQIQLLERPSAATEKPLEVIDLSKELVEPKPLSEVINIPKYMQVKATKSVTEKPMEIKFETREEYQAKVEAERPLSQYQIQLMKDVERITGKSYESLRGVQLKQAIESVKAEKMFPVVDLKPFTELKPMSTMTSIQESIAATKAISLSKSIAIPVSIYKSVAIQTPVAITKQISKELAILAAIEIGMTKQIAPQKAISTDIPFQFSSTIEIPRYKTPTTLTPTTTIPEIPIFRPPEFPPYTKPPEYPPEKPSTGFPPYSPPYFPGMKLPKIPEDERKRRKAKGRRKESYLFREYIHPIIEPLDTVKDISRTFENIARTMTGKKPKKIIKLGRYKKSRY